jgi:hypothetical protein
MLSQDVLRVGISCEQFVSQGFRCGVYTGHLVRLISVFLEDNQLHTYLYTLDQDMIRDRDWARSWTAWHTPADQREALRTHVVARYGARYELIAPPAPRRRRHEQS